MPPAADGAASHAEQCQDHPGNQDNDADRPGNCDVRDEADDEEDNAENYQLDSQEPVVVMDPPRIDQEAQAMLIWLTRCYPAVGL